MQVEDQRQKAVTLKYDDLNRTEQDEYTDIETAMRLHRVCSRCRRYFTLATTLGDDFCCEGRDHVDHDTESVANEMRFTYRTWLVLCDRGVWPTHPRIGKNTRQVGNLEDTNETAIEIVVDRVPPISPLQKLLTGRKTFRGI